MDHPARPLPLFAEQANWISERLRDVAQWPINLIRDLPFRLARLLAELSQVVLGPAHYLGRRRQPGELQYTSIRSASHRAAAWAHRLLVALFDLLGGPEIAQFLLRLVMPATPLTAAEIREVASVLGDRAIRWGDVRVAQGGLLRLIFRYNGSRAFATWHTIYLPLEGKHSRSNYSLLVHELTHVFQYEQVGSRYLTEAIYIQARMGGECYRYGGRAGMAEACQVEKPYADYNREAQAQIAQDYYWLRHQGEDTTVYEPFVAQLRSARF